MTRCWKASCSATRGAFTGADRRKKGRFEQADGGTLFSTRSATSRRRCRPSSSASCNRARSARRRHRDDQVDVRIVAATNKRLEDEVKAGRFRPDLYYRLNVVRLDLPAAPRACRGHPAAGHALPREAHAEEHPAGHRDRLRGDAGAARAHLARARPRAGERDQGGGRNGRGHGDPPRSLPATVAPRKRATEARRITDRHRAAPARPDWRPDRRRSSATISHGCSRDTRGTSPGAPSTAACRVGASPRSFKSRASTARGSRMLRRWTRTTDGEKSPRALPSLETNLLARSGLLDHLVDGVSEVRSGTSARRRPRR